MLTTAVKVPATLPESTTPTGGDVAGAQIQASAARSAAVPFGAGDPMRVAGGRHGAGRATGRASRALSRLRAFPKERNWGPKPAL